MSGNLVKFEVVSAGCDFGNTAEIKINDIPVIGLGACSRGLNVAVVDETSGAVVLTKAYDTYAGGAAADAFADLIEQTPIGRIVCVAVKDEAKTNLTERARRACRMIGSGLIENLAYRGSWAIIGQRGAAPGAVTEQLSNSSSVTAQAQITIRPAGGNGLQISARSAGYVVGNSASIAIHGVEVPITGGYRRGLNVVVMDGVTAAVVEAHTYDTYGSVAAADEFAALVEGLPPGRMVAIAVMDEASANLTERAKVACEALGSALIRSLGIRGSWSLIGFKGALYGTVAESLSASAPVNSVYWHSPETPNPKQGFPVALRSAGYAFGNMASLMIGHNPARAFGLPGTASTGRGLNVAVLSEATGELVEFHNYDTHASAADADAFAALVERTPVGHFVVVAAMDEATNSLTERAKRACEMIGSGLIRNLMDRGSWAIIGRKGCAPGSAPEALMNDGAVGIETWFAVEGSHGGRPFVEVRTESAGFSVGNYASITVAPNPNHVYLASGYGRGLNVGVLDEQTGNVILARSFDTHDDSSAANEFAELIEGLPSGRIVAISVKDEAVNKLTERAKKACETLGSGMIRNLGDRNSWAFVGKKGASPLAVAEAISNGSPASSRYWLFPDTRFPVGGFNISAKSAGFSVGNSAQIASGEAVIEIRGGYRRGLNVAVINEKDGSVISADAYDTHEDSSAADQFAALIESLPPGRMVAIAVRDEATNKLSERAKRACETLGSGMIRNLGNRGSWALIGVKGTAPGSVLEQMDNNGPTSVSTWMPFPGKDAANFLPLIPLFFGGMLILVVMLIILITQVVPKPAPPHPIPPLPPPQPPPPIKPLDMANWLKDMPDDRPICDINVPGTHDSAAINRWMSTLYACHRTSITQQLDSGIRLLDIRLKVKVTETGYEFVTCHGDCLSGIGLNEYQSFESALQECRTFLVNHPSEFIAMSLKMDDWNGIKDEKDQKAVCAALATFLSNYPVSYGPKMPHLQEVRGKIYLIARTDSKIDTGVPVKWNDNTGGSVLPVDKNRYFWVYVQDQYKDLPVSGPEEAKLRLFTNTIGQKTDGLMVLNFASATSASILGVYIMDLLLAFFGNNTANNRPKKMGWSFFDYETNGFSTDLYGVLNCVQIIVASNFEYRGYDGKFTVYQYYCDELGCFPSPVRV